jgi:hypothetical protein
LFRFVLLEVERDAFLGTIGPDKMRCHPLYALVIGARRIAYAGPFDLDDTRTEIRELPGTERSGNDMLKCNDSNAFQRSHQKLFLLSTAFCNTAFCNTVAQPPLQVAACASAPGSIF